MKTGLIPIFFSVSDACAPLLATAIHSIKENASRAYEYRIHILTDDLSAQNRKRLLRYSDERFHIAFYPLSGPFPLYDKLICLDADIVVPGDISRLYSEPLGDKLVGAVADYRVSPTELDPGVLLLNGKRIREKGIPSQLQREHILFLDPDWNAIPSEHVSCLDNPQIIHFASDIRPWLDDACPCGEVFWKYVSGTGFEAAIRSVGKGLEDSFHFLPNKLYICTITRNYTLNLISFLWQKLRKESIVSAESMPRAMAR